MIMKWFTKRMPKETKKPFDLEYAKWRSEMEWLFNVNENLDDFKEMSNDEFKRLIDSRINAL